LTGYRWWVLPMWAVVVTLLFAAAWRWPVPAAPPVVHPVLTHHVYLEPWIGPASR